MKNIYEIKGCKHRKYEFSEIEAWSTCLLDGKSCSCTHPPSTIEVARKMGCKRAYEPKTEYKIKTNYGMCSGCEKCGESELD